MRFSNHNLVRALGVFGAIFGILSIAQVADASPFGQGVFGAHVPFGSATSLTISLGGNVTLALTPDGSTFSANGSHTITVTSTDVVGYGLYIYTPGGTAMTGSGGSIPASSNSTPAALATNTWGYNTTGSTTNYSGVTTTPTLLKSASGPYESGDNTTVNYGVLTDITKGAGSYTVSVTYTAVALTE